MSVDIDADQIREQVFSAVKGVIGDLPAEQAAAVRAESDALAAAFTDIATQRAAGTINDEQAKAFLSAQAQTAEAALQAKLGISALEVRRGVQAGLKAGLNVIIEGALAATGMAWARPLIDGVLAGVAISTGMSGALGST
jgi:hypothetical protein